MNNHSLLVRRIKLRWTCHFDLFLKTCVFTERPGTLTRDCAFYFVGHNEPLTLFFKPTKLIAICYISYLWHIGMLWFNCWCLIVLYKWFDLTIVRSVAIDRPLLLLRPTPSSLPLSHSLSPFPLSTRSTPVTPWSVSPVGLSPPLTRGVFHQRRLRKSETYFAKSHLL